MVKRGLVRTPKAPKRTDNNMLIAQLTKKSCVARRQIIIGSYKTLYVNSEILVSWKLKISR